jgi:FkbM family methyltransferase
VETIRVRGARAARQAGALGPRSFGRYAVWRSGGQPGEIELRLRGGLRVVVRPGADYWTLSEIFFARQYDAGLPLPRDMRTIVDVGANVGYATLWFLHRHPAARVLAFEPVPEHQRQIERHLRMNSLAHRVELVAAAATTADGTARLDPEGPESRLVDEASEGAITVPTVDWFARLPEGRIDLVKMDIEGAECRLLDDPRFPAVATRSAAWVVEWHMPVDGRGGRDWCAERLERAGFRVSDGAQYGRAGLLWGTR